MSNQLVYLGIASGQTEARTDAELARYDVIIMHIWEGMRVSSIKTINPDIKIFAYKEMTGVAATPDGSGLYASGVSKTEADANPTWYLVDNTTGLPVTYSDFPDIRFVDQGLPAYQARWASNVINELRTYGFDGVFADDVNADYSIHYAGTLHDQGTASGDPLTAAEYQSKTRSMLTTITPLFHAVGLRVIGNISNAATIDIWTDWVTLIDGASREFYTKFGTGDSTGVIPQFPAILNSRFIDQDWGNEVTLFHQASNLANSGFLPIIYSVAADVKSKRYARASFLLDWDSSKSELSGLCWDNSDNPTVDSFSNDWAITIGDPIGNKYNVDDGPSFWVRRFTGGFVVLNASGAAHTFDLTGGSLTTQDGSTAGSSISIGAAEAMVFTGSPPPLPDSSTFGRLTIGGSWNNNGSDSKQVVKFVLAQDSKAVTKLSAYLDGNGPTGSGTQVIRAVIYDDVIGIPTSLIAVSNEVIIAHAQVAGWVDFEFNSPIELEPGTYWLGMIFGVSSNISRWAYSSGAGSQWAFNTDTYSDNPSNPFGIPSYGSVVFSIYASLIDVKPSRLFAQSILDALAPMLYAELDAPGPLTAYLTGLSVPFELVEEWVSDTDTDVGWSLLLDPDRVPEEALQWLAQIVGLTLPTSISAADQRQLIKDAPNWKRGTIAAMKAAPAPYMTGTKTVLIRERYDGTGNDAPYYMEAVTDASEVLDAVKVEAAIRSQKPAGIILTYVNSTGPDLQYEKDHYATLADIKSAYATLNGVKTNTLGA